VKLSITLDTLDVPTLHALPRILERLGEHVAAFGDSDGASGPVRDHNGQEVGSWTMGIDQDPFHPDPEIAAEIAQDAAEADAVDEAVGFTPRTATGPRTTADDLTDLANEGGMLGGTDEGHASQPVAMHPDREMLDVRAAALDALRDEYEDMMRQGNALLARDALERRDALLQSSPRVKIGRVTYLVERRTSTETPYVLHGPRGACYGLMRNVNTPTRLFMFNMRGFTHGTPDVWFRDDGGELRPC
jgi:hypothetical protein